MKKNKRTILISLLILVFIVSSFFGIFYCHSILTKESDNHGELQQIITRHYSQKKLDELERLVAEKQLSLKSFKLNYRPQCIRETPQGEYAVLLGEDGERFFVFWTKDENLYATYRTTKFLEEKDFSFTQPGKTTVDDVLQFDKNTISIPGATHIYTGHIVKKGTIALEYDASHILKNTTYLSNQDLLNIESVASPFIFIPNILEQDKQ